MHKPVSECDLLLWSHHKVASTIARPLSAGGFRHGHVLQTGTALPSAARYETFLPGP